MSMKKFVLLIWYFSKKNQLIFNHQLTMSPIYVDSGCCNCWVKGSISNLVSVMRSPHTNWTFQLHCRRDALKREASIFFHLLYYRKNNEIGGLEFVCGIIKIGSFLVHCPLKATLALHFENTPHTKFFSYKDHIITQFTVFKTSK